MEKKEEKYENFEIDDLEEKQTEEEKKNSLYFKISIVMIVLVVMEVIGFYIIFSKIKEKNTSISENNLKKYIIDDGNKKLDRILKDYYEKDYAYDEETAKKDSEIKSKEQLTQEYIYKIERLQKKLNDTITLGEMLDINDDKENKIYELRFGLHSRTLDFREDKKTKILDSSSDIDYIKSLLKLKNYDAIKLAKSFSFDILDDKEIDYNKINYAINFNENPMYVLIFQTSTFGRYGAIIDNENNKDKYIIFDMNYKTRGNYEYAWLKYKLDNSNLETFINTILEYKFKNKHKGIDYFKYTKITQIELFKAY